MLRVNVDNADVERGAQRLPGSSYPAEHAARVSQMCRVERCCMIFSIPDSVGLENA